jgi:hypothetical protein
VEFTSTDGTYGKSVDHGSVRVIREGAGSVSPSATSPSPTAAGAATGRYGPPVKPFPIPPLHGDRAIVRQNSVTNAVNLFLHTNTDEGRYAMTPDEITNAVLQLARNLEAYSCGDLEAAEAAA